MIMHNRSTCPGDQGVKPQHLEALAAELVATTAFFRHFQKRHADAVPLPQLGYIGDNADNNPFVLERFGPNQFPADDFVTDVADTLASDFRNWYNKKGRENKYGHRKADMLVVSKSAGIGEILEVTTGKNRHSAIKQVRDKLQILDTVNKVLHLKHNRRIQWRATTWRPASGTTHTLATSPGSIKWICFEPTRRFNAPHGVALYEIHKSDANRTMPVVAPQESLKNLERITRRSLPQPDSVEAWVRNTIAANPGIASQLRALTLALGVGAAIAAVALSLTPVIGDELLVGTVALALINAAQRAQPGGE